MDLETPVEKVPRISAPYQKKLKKLGIKTLQDLIFHFPRRYEDFSNIVPISEIKLGETVCVRGQILEIENRKTPVKKMILTEAIVQDKTGAIKVVWFNQPYLLKNLKEEDEVCLAGKVLLGGTGVYLSSPAYEKISPSFRSMFGGRTSEHLIHAGRIVPVYPETEGLSSRWLRYILRPLLLKLKGKITETLPFRILKEEDLLPMEKAVWQIHFPDSKKLAQKAQQRFSFEELFFLELFVLKEKIKLSGQKGISVPINLEVLQDFVKSLPFKLTKAQKKSSWQILKDLQKAQPMNRLLQGDVGSGKTVVALMASLNVAMAGLQAGFMVPTEILAKQHFQEVSKLFQNFVLEIGLLTGKEGKIFTTKQKKLSSLSRKKMLERLKKGVTRILIGTHALIQEGVKFGNLGLVILDEQHRFGVEQRAKLIHQTLNTNNQQLLIPHFLSMTATPIPRTLALTVYGDLDLSIIDELPRGRKKIITKVVSPGNRKKAYQFIKDQIKKGRQAFVICPRIERPEADVDAEAVSQNPKNAKTITSWSEVKAVKEEYEKLSKEIFPDLSIGMLHGKMKPEEKEKTMQDFKNRKIDILVSTSVVEVGIDVPNASVMMIEGAERFGLAQLYQFKGRVGRSKHQSFCFLFTESASKKVAKRLEALRDCEDGLILAEQDLKIRGPGDFFGKRQWGIPDLAMSALKNISLVKKTREAAKKILIEDSELKKYPVLKNSLKKFIERIHLE